MGEVNKSLMIDITASAYIISNDNFAKLHRAPLDQA